MSSGWDTRRPQVGSPSSRGYGETWRQVRLFVLARDNWTCMVRLSPKCVVDLRSRPGVATVDHILAKALGGTDHPANLRASCRPCNMKLGAALGYQRQQAAQQAKQHRNWVW